MVRNERSSMPDAYEATRTRRTQALPAASSERDLVVHVVATAGAGHGGLARRCAAATGGTGATGARAEIGPVVVGAEPTTATTAGAVEQHHLGAEVLQDDLSGIAILAALILPFAGLQLPLEVNPRA